MAPVANKNTIRNMLALPAALLAAACAVGKDYSPPDYTVDGKWSALHEEWNGAAPKAASPASSTLYWWRWFADDALSDLVEDAVANNHDLKSAVARIREARANELLTQSTLFPHLDATATRRRGTLSSVNGEPLDTETQYGVSGDWEVDVFGGNRRRAEAGRYGADAAAAAMQRTRLLLISDVGRNYMRLRGLQKQLELTRRNLGLQEDARKVTQAWRDENMVSELDVSRSRAQAESTRALIPQIRAEMNAVINRLAVLTASTPQAMRERLGKPAPIPQAPEEVALALPVEVIRARPDVRAAERRLAEATALSGAAFAAFFPRLTLQGFFGGGRSDIFGTLSPWNATLSALMPLLDFGRIRAGVNAAEARQEQAYHNFRQAVLLAVEDVEVSLYAYLSEKERRRSLAEAAGAQGSAVSIAREQYLSGIASQLDLLDAQRNALAADTQLVGSETLIAENMVRLLASLSDGGIPEEQAEALTPVDEARYVYPDARWR